MRCFYLIFITFCFLAMVNCRRRQRNQRLSEVAPFIIGANQSVVGMVGETVVLVCNATGTPLPNIDWYKEENSKASRNRYEINSESNREWVTSTLWIPDARRKRDGVLFFCRVTNKAGTDQSEVQVTLLNADEKPSGFPQIIDNPRTTTVQNNKSVSLPCEVKGSPEPTVRWFKDYLPLNTSGSRVFVSPTGSLNIFRSNDHDNGRYHCIAENIHGIVVSDSASIYVRSRRFPSRFSIPPNPVYQVQQNANLNITCVAVGAPMPNVKWQKETRWGPEDIPMAVEGRKSSMQVEGNEIGGRLVGKVKLLLYNVQETSRYTCVARSTINTISFTTEVQVKALPKPPVDVGYDVVTDSPERLVLFWQPGDTEGVTSYVMYYRQRSANSLFQSISDISSTRYTIDGLQPYTDYEFRIAAVNSQGQGNKSQSLIARTLEAKPASPPIDITAYLYGINTAMVLWFEPKTPNGQITEYKLYYSSNFLLPLEEWNILTVSGSKRLTSLRNLVPSVTYSIRVSAINSIGEGPLSPPVLVKTTQGVPSQPRNFRETQVTRDSIRFEWDEPDGDTTSDRQLISYTLSYECISSRCSDKKQITLSPSNQFTLLHLRPYKTYNIRIAAQTRFGKGPYTGNLTVTTLADVPNAAPQNVAAVAIDEYTLKVDWNPPPEENRNGVITGYTLYYSLVNAQSVNRIVCEADDDSKSIGNLFPFTTYSVSISASTSIGEGPRSPVVQVTTAESIPSGAPRNVSAEPLSSTSIRVYWTSVPNNQKNGNIRGYQVAYGITDDPLGRTVIVSTYEGELVDVNQNEVLEYTVNNLKPNTRYSLSVAAFTIKGAGQASGIQYATTRRKVPGIPRLDAKIYNFSVVLSWESPSDSDDDLTAYLLKYRCDNCPENPYSIRHKWNIKRFDHTIQHYKPTSADGVVPGWTYTFSLSALNGEESGEESTRQLSVPSTIPSEAPSNLSGETIYTIGRNDVSSATNIAIRLKWSPLSWSSSNGPITGYTVYWRFSVTSPEQYTRIAVKNTTLYLPNVQLKRIYDFQVSATNQAGEGPRSQPYIITASNPTLIKKNISVDYLRVQEISPNAVWLLWEAPDPSNNVLYSVHCSAVSERNPRKIETKIPRTIFSNLSPEETYNFTITLIALNDGNRFILGSAWLVVQTAPRLIEAFPAFLPQSSNSSTITLHLDVATKNNAVEKYLIVMIPYTNEGNVLNPNAYSMLKLERNSINQSKRKKRDIRSSQQPYITAQLDPNVPPLDFVIGDGRKYGQYLNRPLQRGLKYKSFIRVVLSIEPFVFSSSPLSDEITIPKIQATTNSFALSDQTNKGDVEETSPSAWIAAVIVSVVLIIGAFAGVFLCLRKRRKDKASSPLIKYSAPVATPKKILDRRVDHDPVEMRRKHCLTSGMKNHPPIPVAEMSDHVARLSANDNLKFSQEYESIDPGQQFMWEHSAMEVNKSKNRYANVVAYDHTRLTLSPIDGVPGSDYINANYISGYRRQNAYIATQGPTKETSGDFWRMVWEQRSSVVVMMTSCEERSKVKCEQYWPSKGSCNYGMMKVTLVDEMELATYSIRNMTLYKNNCQNERRDIKHFQYTAWPDHGVPKHATPVLNFMRRVKSSFQPDSGPIVVHCSAGVGRAGCFICIDSMLDRMKHENTIDVYGQVTCMRAERNYMVQTEEQYIFIHDALLEAIKCGNTEIPAQNLYNHLAMLTKSESDNGVTEMELEFKRLANTRAPVSQFVSANMTCNKFKNRLVNILPYEDARVCLQPTRGLEGSDYINASFIDGYRQKRAYIATQGPLPETSDDMWRMLWEHNSTIVVMLTQLRENGRDKCHQYWPVERSARYQYFVVDPMAEYRMQQYVLREFKVTDARDGQSRTIRQFHFTDWPEQAVPKSGEGFIDFIGQVHKTKEQFGQEGPITIHCSAGVGRTGVFITLSIALERMRFENVVDMFQTVKMLRTQRPAMVQTEDQYQFCYRAALEYLGSFDHYTTA